MGMAASQARFLGLTARKSNVEYQGQQVNQERTALANDSANLYNQMMALDVPTPPSTGDYFKTSYVLDNSANGYDMTDYSFISAEKTYSGQGNYKINLMTKRETIARENPLYYLNYAKANEEDGTIKISLRYTNSNSSTILTYNENDLNPHKTSGNGNTSTNLIRGQIYEADETIDGYSLCCDKEGTKYYFYQALDPSDKTGKTYKNYFITKEQLDDMLNGNVDDKKPESYSIATTYVYTKDEIVPVTGNLETADSGRYSSIIIDSENEQNPENLRGKTFTITTVQEKDDQGYEQAYNDYQYEKDVYEHTIDEINAKTEVIQNEDKQLELRLRELETEQNAISTEMDSVKKVIEDNVEKTFNIFG